MVELGWVLLGVVLTLVAIVVIAFYYILRNPPGG